MDGNTITLPVTATMSKQPDGSYSMLEPEYITVPVSAVARFLLERFHIPTEQKEVINADR